MIRGLFSQQPPTPPRAGTVSSPVETSVAQAARKANGAMAADALVTKTAESSLENRVMYARVPARGLLDILRDGTLPPDATSFHLDTFPDVRSRALIVPLTDEGKKALLDQTPGLAESLAAGKDVAIEAKTPVQLGSHVQEILIDPEQKQSVLKAYEELVAKGEAPETIAGKPFKTFFEQHVRATEDVYGEMELKNFRKQVPGFDQLPVLEQKVRASLGGKMADTWPASIPADVRRQMANTMIRHKALNRPDPGAGLKAAGQIKEFFHGTTMGDMVGRIGFRGQPEMLFNELPKSVQGVLTKKFHVKFASVLGPGVYYGNSSVASNYAILKLMGNKPVQVVSGLVAQGQTTTKEFVNEDTRIALGDASGAYYVTKDPKRFSIKGVTTLDPKQTDGLMRYFPQIMKAHETDPLAVGYLVDRLPKGPSQRALEEALKTGDATTRRSATILLARRGQEASVASTLKLLETESSPEIKDALMAAARSIGPGHSNRTTPIAEAVLKSTQAGGDERSEVVSRLSASLGEELKPLFERYGVTLDETVAHKGWTDRAVELFSKGIKRRH